jgi:hypothetical protein
MMRPVQMSGPPRIAEKSSKVRIFRLPALRRTINLGRNGLMAAGQVRSFVSSGILVFGALSAECTFVATPSLPLLVARLKLLAPVARAIGMTEVR